MGSISWPPFFGNSQKWGPQQGGKSVKSVLSIELRLLKFPLLQPLLADKLWAATFRYVLMTLLLTYYLKARRDGELVRRNQMEVG